MKTQIIELLTQTGMPVGIRELSSRLECPMQAVKEALDELMNEGELQFGDEIRLEAKVEDVNLNYRMIWEANDDDERGWYTIASGEKYSYTLTAENVNREYRVVLFSLD